MVTQQEVNQALNKVKDQIMQAVKDYHNNPEKATPYIMKRIDALYNFAVEYGKQSLTHELFNGDCNA